MGLFISYCKNCKCPIRWFLNADEGISCIYCGYKNTKKDLLLSQETQKSYLERFLLEERSLKLNKIKKRYGSI